MMMFSMLNMFLIVLGLLFFLFGLYKLFKILKTEHEFVENYLYTYSSLTLSVVIISYVLSQVVFAIVLLILVFLFAVTYVSSHDRLPFKGPIFNIGYRELLGSGFMGMISFVVMLWGLFFMMAYGIAIYSLAMHSIWTSFVVSMLLAVVFGVSVYMIYGNKYYVDLNQTTKIREDIGRIVSSNNTVLRKMPARLVRKQRSVVGTGSGKRAKRHVKKRKSKVKVRVKSTKMLKVKPKKSVKKKLVRKKPVKKVPKRKVVRKKRRSGR